MFVVLVSILSQRTSHTIGFFKRKYINGAVNTVMQDCSTSNNNIHKVLVL